MTAKKTDLAAETAETRQDGKKGDSAVLAQAVPPSAPAPAAAKRKDKRLRAMEKAQAAPDDECYTPFHLIDSEMRFYQEQLTGKRVLCNCDDPTESQFFQYFALNYKRLKLRQLVSTTYRGESRDLFRQNQDAHGLHLQFNGNPRGKGLWMPDDVSPALLKGDGDFRSDECVDILKECDVVVTNPPFSLVLQFIPLMMKHDKKILIIAPYTCVYKKDVFPLIKEGKLWVGYGDYHMKFHTPESRASGGEPDKEVLAVWLTNLGQPREIDPLHLVKTYNERAYPKYDDYDAIEVGKFAQTPKDYDGLMGVPFTCLHKLDRRQFELVEVLPSAKVRGKGKFARLIIRRK